MALLEALTVITVVATIVYLMTFAIIRHTGQPDATATDTGAHWVAAHYTAQNQTRVVVRKVRPDTGDVLDEHVVIEIPNADSDFDVKFLEAMAQARARAALFESESD
jgi:hypothetical protein